MSATLNLLNVGSLSGTYTFESREKAEAVRDALLQVSAALDQSRGWQMSIIADVTEPFTSEQMIRQVGRDD